MKKLLKIGVGCFIAFIICSTIALMGGAGDREFWVEASKKIYAAQGFYEEPIKMLAELDTNDIESLQIHASSDNITIEHTTQDNITIEYYEFFQNQGIYTRSGELLKISRQYKFHFAPIDIDFNDNYDDIKIKLPQGFGVDNLHLSVSSGSLIANDLKADAVYLRVSSGKMTLANCSFKDSELKVSSGIMSISSSYMSKTSANISSGTMELNSLVFDGDLSLKASSGIISATKCIVNGDIDMRTSSGKISFTEGDVLGGTAVIDISSGEIILNNATSISRYQIDVSSGTLRLGIPYYEKDLDISLRCSSGRLSLNNKTYHSGSHANNSAKIKMFVDISSGTVAVTTK